MRMPPPVALRGDLGERDYTSPRFVLGSLTTVTLYHDYICPWCYVGWIHARRLRAQFGIEFDWRGAELIPPGVELPPAPRPREPDAPSRFDRFLHTEGIAMPSPRPAFVRSHRALLGAEFARIEGGDARFDDYNGAVYQAYWERREDISDLDVLARLAESAGLDPSAFRASVESERGANHILPFDEDAYRTGIRHVPSFLFNGEELLAEANYADLAHAAERFLVRREKFLGSKG